MNLSIHWKKVLLFDYTGLGIQKENRFPGTLLFRLCLDTLVPNPFIMPAFEDLAGDEITLVLSAERGKNTD